MTPAQKRAKGFEKRTLMAAWRLLNKADTALMAIPAARPIAKDVLAVMLKIEKLVERTER